MDKANILIIALLVLIFLGFMHSRTVPSTTTTKTVLVKEQPHYYRRYGSNSHYNPYKARYY